MELEKVLDEKIIKFPNGLEWLEDKIQVKEDGKISAPIYISGSFDDGIYARHTSLSESEEYDEDLTNRIAESPKMYPFVLVLCQRQEKEIDNAIRKGQIDI